MHTIKTGAPRRARRLLTAGLLAACVATAGSLTVAPADASATAWNHKWQYMHFPARESDGRCVTRWIDLAADTYRWRIFSAHWAHEDQTRWHSRRIRLRRSQYRWVDCWYADGAAYRHYARLYDERSNGGFAALGPDWQSSWWGDGSYHWGSALDRL